MTFPNDYKRVQQPGGNTADAGSHVGLYNQLIIDNDTRAIRLLDGATPGGVLIPNITTITGLIAAQTGGVKADYDGAAITDVPDKPATRWSPTQLKKIFNEYFDVVNGLIIQDTSLPTPRRNSAQLVTDMNVALKSGWYRIAPGTGTNMPGDTPTSSPDQMMFLVIQSADSDLTQILYSRDLTQKIWIRGRIGSTWGTWALATGVTAADLALKLNLAGGVLTGDLGVTTINGGAQSGYKNLIINPLFYIDERNGGGGISGNGSKPVDCWSQTQVGSSVVSGSRIQGTKVPYAIQFNVTTAQAVIGAGDADWLVTAIEGFDIATALWGTVNAKPITIAFSAKFPTAGTYCLAIRNNANTRSYIIPITVAAGNVLNDYEFTIPGDVTGTWDSSTNIGIHITFTMAAGSTWITATANAWVAGNFAATTGQSNGVATVSNKMVVENPRVNIGNKAIQTEWIPIADHLRRVRRYFGIFQFSQSFYGLASGNHVWTFPFAVRMRITPTFAVITSGSVTNTAADLEIPIGADAMQIGWNVGSTNLSSIVGRVYSLSSEMV